MEGGLTTNEELSKAHEDNLISRHVAERRDMLGRIQGMEQSPKECTTSSFHETGLQRRARHRHNVVSRHVAELRDMLSRIQEMKSRPDCVPQILGELVSLFLLPIVLRITLDRGFTKTGYSNWL